MQTELKRNTAAVTRTGSAGGNDRHGDFVVTLFQAEHLIQPEVVRHSHAAVGNDDLTRLILRGVDIAGKAVAFARFEGAAGDRLTCGNRRFRTAVGRIENKFAVLLMCSSFGGNKGPFQFISSCCDTYGKEQKKR